ncbi:MYG1 family protein [Thalassospira xianhensis]|uniref:MYG1 family protein n=1 Tax=Thalassospira xianhensis TaxID=478503 RepID=UPI000DEDBF7A|nr:MYG1 family protein [Thalassospira xianhensis]
MREKPILATHDGTFHCDDVLAYVLIRRWLAQEGKTEIELVRTRDANVYKDADFVWDVGAVYDPETHRYDHHMPGALLRDDGVPYSAAGLVWLNLGFDICHELYGGFRTKYSAEAEELYQMFMDQDIKFVDWTDDGRSLVEENRLNLDMGLAGLVDAFNQQWFEREPRAGDENFKFLQAARMVESVVISRLSKLQATIEARKTVQKAFDDGQDPYVLVLERNMPWQDAVAHLNLPTLYAVYPSTRNGNEWMVACMSTKPGGFTPTHPFPENWGGLRGDELAKVSGVDNAIFCHKHRFCAAASTLAGAVNLAQNSIEYSQAPSPARDNAPPRGL